MCPIILPLGGFTTFRRRYDDAEYDGMGIVSDKPLIRYELDAIEKRMKEDVEKHGISEEDAFFVIGCENHGPSTCVLTYSEGVLTYMCMECHNEVLCVKVAESHTMFFEPKGVD